MTLRALIDQKEVLRISFGEGIAGLVAQAGKQLRCHDTLFHARVLQGRLRNTHRTRVP